MAKQEKILMAFVFGIMLIGFISSLEDTQIIQICGGDEELLIGCIGDEELIFLAGETPEEALTGLNAQSQKFVEKVDQQPEITLPVLERIKSNTFLLFYIGMLCILVVVLYLNRRKRNIYENVSEKTHRF